MDELEYEKLAAVEDSMWWFRSLHAILVALIEGHGGCHGRLLDAGCGTGGLLRVLEASAPAKSYSGSTCFPAPSPGARANARRGRGRIDQPAAFPGRLLRLHRVRGCPMPFRRRPEVALRELYRCLQPGGRLILQLPAYQWLSSYHDVHCRQVRRFTRAQLSAIVRGHGFAPRFSSYWNLLLFPLVVMRRKLLPLRRSESDVSAFGRPVDVLFGALLKLESRAPERGPRPAVRQLRRPRRQEAASK
jgi:SAM-dependent methyltransferase